MSPRPRSRSRVARPRRDLAARSRAATRTSSRVRLAVLGAGRLGETLVSGLIEAGRMEPGEVVVTTAHPDHARDLARRLGVRAASNLEAVRGAEVVLLGLKPQQMTRVLEEIGPTLTPRQLLISVAASVSTAVIQRSLKHPVPVVRAMPNTPVRVRQGMTALARGAHAREEHLVRAREIFDAVGRTLVVDEVHMDAVTGLSASGPAFLYIVIEALADGGVKVGLPREIAIELAAQTMLGSGAMVLVTGEHPARLKDAVTTPSGTTIDGILELEDGGLRVALIKAVVRATRRAGERAHELFGG